MKSLKNKINSLIKHRDGITLVELIVILAILAILAAIVVPSLIGYIDLSKRKVCETNRLTLLRHYKTYLILEPEYSLNEYLENNISSMQCPSGGTYTVVVNPYTHEESLSCSKHGDINSNPSHLNTPSITTTHPITNTPNATPTPIVTPTPSATPNILRIPSTNVDVNSQWPEDSSFFNSNNESIKYDVYKGQTFYYEGQYYLVSHDVIDLYLYGGVPSPTNGWWFNNGIIKVKNMVIQWDGGTTSDFNLAYKNNLPQAGDICYCKVNGVYNYYVFTLNNQSWVDPPNHNMLNWIKLESTFH